jgi:hypothetical protein
MSNMTTRASNRWGQYNVTLLGGCRRLSRRKVGIIADDFFLDNFAHMFNDTIRKS